MSSYKAYLKELTSLEDIIKKIDAYGVGFIAVVKEDETLFGIVTDGDVRRALINKKQKVLDIINTQPMTLPSQTPKPELVSFLKKKRRLHVPLVDDQQRLVQVFSLNAFEGVPTRPNYVVIMVGGLGSRLGPLTKKVPKPMLEIKGKPILEYIIESFKNQGFEKFLLCVNYKREIIEDHFKDGSQMGVSIEYIVEEKRMGTAGALSLIDPNTFQDPFFVVNGDVISSIDYDLMLQFYDRQRADAVMCVKQLSYTNPYAEVDFDEDFNLQKLREKPTNTFYINLGMYLLNKKMLEFLPKNEFYDMPNLFLKGKEGGHATKVYLVSDEWVDIGKPIDYHSITNNG